MYVIIIPLPSAFSSGKVKTYRVRSLMTSLIREGRGSKIAPKKGCCRVGQGRSEMAKKRGTSLMNVPIEGKCYVSAPAISFCYIFFFDMTQQVRFSATSITVFP